MAGRLHNSLWDNGIKDETLSLIYYMNVKANVIVKTPFGDTDPMHPGFYLGFFVWGGVDPEENFGATRRRENFFRPFRGSGGMLPRKILKI